MAKNIKITLFNKDKFIKDIFIIEKNIQEALKSFHNKHITITHVKINDFITLPFNQAIKKSNPKKNKTRLKRTKEPSKYLHKANLFID